MNNFLIIFILLILNIYCKEYTYFEIPPPNIDPTFCNRKSNNSFICNPDKIISDSMADKFDEVANKLIDVGPNVMCWIDRRNVTNRDGYLDPLNYAKNLAIEWSNLGYSFDIITVVSIRDKYLDIIIYSNIKSGTSLNKDISRLKEKLQYKVNLGKYDEAVQEYIDYINVSNGLTIYTYIFVSVISCIAIFAMVISCIFICFLIGGSIYMCMCSKNRNQYHSY